VVHASPPCRGTRVITRPDPIKKGVQRAIEDILIGGGRPARDENGCRHCQAKLTSRVRIRARRDGFRGRAGARPRRRPSSTMSARVGGTWPNQSVRAPNGSVPFISLLLCLSLRSTPAAPVPSPTRRPVEFERPALLLPSTGGSDAGKALDPRRACQFLMRPLLIAAPD
jgi:hypothetical protein